MIITEMPVFTTFWVEKITILKQARDGPICIECQLYISNHEILLLITEKISEVQSLK